MKNRVHGTLVLACLFFLGRAAQADVVTQWNSVVADTIRMEGGPPGPTTRVYTLVHVSIYDAVNSIDKSHYPYHVSVDAAPGASKIAAAAAAAHRIMTHVIPDHNDMYDAALAESLAEIQDAESASQGIVVGTMVADAILALRSGDGAEPQMDYIVSEEPGQWRPTFPDFTSQPFSPSWGRCKPWTMNSGSMFRPEPPPALTSAEYAAAWDEVKSLGRIDSASRTADQTEIAWFWANDRNGTYKPTGHLNAITQVIAAQQGNSLEENARLFALVNLALAEAAIVAWDAKYETNLDLWRPITGIRLADTDGNPATSPEVDWEPLGDFTPPFPAYTSGHATFAGAHAAVLADFYGTDDISFTVGTDEPIVANVKRTFSSFSQAGLENARSRVFLGVHWAFDSDVGYSTGRSVGDYVAGSYLSKLPTERDNSGALCGAGALTSLSLTGMGLVGFRRRSSGVRSFSRSG